LTGCGTYDGPRTRSAAVPTVVEPSPFPVGVDTADALTAPPPSGVPFVASGDAIGCKPMLVSGVGWLRPFHQRQASQAAITPPPISTHFGGRRTPKS